MRVTDWKFVLVAAALVLAAGGAIALKPSRMVDPTAAPLATAIPMAFGDWKVDPNITPIPPSPDVQARLEQLYDQIVSRTYVNSRGERMMLTVAYGGDQSDALKAHRQEVCYSAQGFQIHYAYHGRLRFSDRSIPVTRMLAVRGPRAEPVTYWFTMGDRVVLGRLERLVVQIRFGLSGSVPDGMLVRVSNISTDPAKAFDAQEQFVSALLAGVQPREVSRLLGATRS
jgi:EpsI family protein